jgi:hypothetical protein
LKEIREKEQPIGHPQSINACFEGDPMTFNPSIILSTQTHGKWQTYTNTQR